MRWKGALGVVVMLAASVAVLPVAGQSASRTPGKRPEVAIFYYSWYGTPQSDGDWHHWRQGDAAPPERIASSFYPARGPYSSSDGATVAAQMREIARSGIGTVVVSWWGWGSPEDRRLDLIHAHARTAGLKVALHLEPWPGRTAAAVADAIRVMWGRGIHDFYVYDSSAISEADWATALATVPEARVFANTWLPGVAKAGGFDGLYNYDVLVYDGRSFRRICTSARRLGLLCAPSVGPGFDGRRSTPVQVVATRRQGRRYDSMWRAALEAAPDLVTITSYNEWHEGTQIEPARRRDGYQSYDGAWRLRGTPAETAYLERTAYWVLVSRGLAT